MSLLLTVGVTVGYSSNIVQSFGTPASATGSGTPTPLFGYLINFDDKASGTVVNPDDYAGVTITALNNHTLYRWDVGTQSQPNYVGEGEAQSGWALDVLFTFDVLQDKIGIGIADDPTTFTFYGSTGEVLYTWSNTKELNYYTVFTDTDGPNIASMRVESDFAAFDDLQFSRVPDPANTGVLLMGALLVVGVVARKFGLR
jgi:hypothetical protein